MSPDHFRRRPACSASPTQSLTVFFTARLGVERYLKVAGKNGPLNISLYVNIIVIFAWSDLKLSAILLNAICVISSGSLAEQASSPSCFLFLVIGGCKQHASKKIGGPGIQRLRSMGGAPHCHLFATANLEASSKTENTPRRAHGARGHPDAKLPLSQSSAGKSSCFANIKRFASLPERKGERVVRSWRRAPVSAVGFSRLPPCPCRQLTMHSARRLASTLAERTPNILVAGSPAVIKRFVEIPQLANLNFLRRCA